MPIDPSKALGAVLPALETSWTPDDVLLYHLGIGAGADPTDPNELEYAYESNLKVLPSFATIPPFAVMGGIGGVDGLEFNFALLLHGEQEIQVPRPIPTAASASHEGRIAEIYDKGKGALVIIETESRTSGGELLFVNRSSVFLRGEGGFGGDPGPSARFAAPDREPDHVVESPTLPQQALWYRLSGDKNPLHADPAFAAMGGFDRPILHGLCSYGIVCKAAVDTYLGGDVSRVRGYAARFTGAVFPGETVVTRMWETDEGLVLDAVTKDRGSRVISNARLEEHS